MCVGCVTPPSIIMAVEEAIWKNGFAVEEVATANSGEESDPLPPTKENLAYGEVVPIPTFPEEITFNAFEPTVRSDENRFVELAVVEKKFVVVALVPVAFLNVKS